MAADNVFRDLACVMAFVEAPLGKTYGERFQRAVLRRECGNGARVESTGQKNAKRHIGDQA